MAVVLMASIISSVTSHASCDCATCQILKRYAMPGQTLTLLKTPIDLPYDYEGNYVYREPTFDDVYNVAEHAEATFKVITQNLRVNNAGDGEGNSLIERLPRIEQVLKGYGADVYCFQECSTEWKPYADDMMPSNEYECVFMKTNVGHCNPIYIKRSECAIIESGSFVISEINAEDYNENRVASWVILKKNNSAKTMLVINAHLPVTNNTQNVACQKIMEFVKTKTVDGYVICGDFNFTKEGNVQAYNTMTAEGTKDLEFAAASEGTVGEIGPTFHDYGRRENPIKIDYFFGSDSVISTKYSVIKDMVDGKYLSDHYGIYQEATI